jgi:hypothetical protein
VDTQSWRHTLVATAATVAVVVLCGILLDGSAAPVVGAQVVAGGGAGSAAGVVAPQTAPAHHGILGLGRNYPNPFNPTTRIPFTVGDPPVCPSLGQGYRVSLKVYNLLAQLVAVPTLVAADGSIVSGPSLGGLGGAGQPVQDLALPCGQYTAYWNGNYLTSGREVAPGMYLYRLEVNGRAVVKKMFVQR